MAEDGVLRVRAVVFDVGETLVDESTEYGTWADWLGVPRHTFSAVFGAVIAQGRDYRETFQHFRPDFDLTVERRHRADAGAPERFGEADLYPDARECLAALRARGFVVGIAGNQTLEAEKILRALDLPADFIGTSASWQTEKPAAAFFTRMVHACGCQPGEIVYVGDRLDNDILPALEAGMKTALVCRGPWGHVTVDAPEAARAHLRLGSLTDLPGWLALQGG